MLQLFCPFRFTLNFTINSQVRGLPLASSIINQVFTPHPSKLLLEKNTVHKEMLSKQGCRPCWRCSHVFVIFRCFDRCNKSQKGLLKSLCILYFFLSHHVVRNCQLLRDDKQPEYVCVSLHIVWSVHDGVMPAGSSSSRVIVHVDLDCFYAQVEMILNPELKGKPLGNYACQ